ncbi:MAG: transporter substrate-binding domain-containing protein, partial [Oscillospiraceae bacterium]
TSSQAIMVNADSNIKSQADLAGKTISATEATTGADVAKEMAETLGGETKAIEGDIDVLTESLKAGAIAAIIAERPVMEAYAKANSKFVVLDDILTDEQTKVVVKNGNELLLAAVNEAIAAFKTQENYDQIVLDYFG